MRFSATTCLLVATLGQQVTATATVVSTGIVRDIEELTQLAKGMGQTANAINDKNALQFGHILVHGFHKISHLLQNAPVSGNKQLKTKPDGSVAPTAWQLMMIQAASKCVQTKRPKICVRKYGKALVNQVLSGSPAPAEGQDGGDLGGVISGLLGGLGGGATKGGDALGGLSDGLPVGGKTSRQTGTLPRPQSSTSSPFSVADQTAVCDAYIELVSAMQNLSQAIQESPDLLDDASLSGPMEKGMASAEDTFNELADAMMSTVPFCSADMLQGKEGISSVMTDAIQAFTEAAQTVGVPN